MNKNLLSLSVLVILLTLPAVTLADLFPPLPNGNIILNPAILITGVLSFIWPIVVGIVIIMFIIAGFMFLTAQGDPGKVHTARLAVIWGVVGVLVILLAFSIIAIIQFAFGLF